MVLTAPEFVESELVQMLGEIEVAPELQHRVLAEGVMRGQKSAEADAGHEVSLPKVGSVLAVRRHYGRRSPVATRVTAHPSTKSEWQSCGLRAVFPSERRMLD